MRRTLAALLLISTVPAGSAYAVCPAGAVVSFLHPSDRPISTGYGVTLHLLLNVERMHQGIDYAGPIGDAVKAAAGGTVVSSGSGGPAGFAVTIRHADGAETRYHHMLARDVVKPGDCVTAGQIIGQIGSTGLSSWPHLHFEVLRDGAAIDPVTVLAKR